MSSSCQSNGRRTPYCCYHKISDKCTKIRQCALSRTYHQCPTMRSVHAGSHAHVLHTTGKANINDASLSGVTGARSESSPPNLQAVALECPHNVVSPCFPDKSSQTLLYDSTCHSPTPSKLPWMKKPNHWTSGTLMKAAMLAVACKLLLHCLFTLERSLGEISTWVYLDQDEIWICLGKNIKPQILDLPGCSMSSHHLQVTRFNPL